MKLPSDRHVKRALIGMKYSRPFALNLFRGLLGRRQIEHSYLLFLYKGRIVEVFHARGTRWNVKQNVFLAMVSCYASNIIMDELVLLHNHPGSNPSPSGGDVKSFYVACSASYPTVELRDYIIVARERYFSAAQDGLVREVYRQFRKQRQERGE